MNVKRLVEHEKEKYGWEFIFLGADIDAVETAGRIGIDLSRAANYRKDRVGNETMFCSVNEVITMTRACAPPQRQLESGCRQRFRGTQIMNALPFFKYKGPLSGN